MPSFDLPLSDRYLVALSGGADSRLLLELTARAVLARRADEDRPITVMAAHLHHGIRGEEADRDEAFCRRVCADLGVPLVVEHMDIPKMAAASGRSLETEAREARYAFLTRTMRAQNIPLLLTAHHADDQLETVLYHLLRGSGTKGMGGIPAMRRLHPNGELVSPHDPPPAVARPLLTWSKREILDACRDYGLDYVTDSTNLPGAHVDADAYTRNRLRHTVIPALEAIAGEDIPQRAATRLSRAAREDDEALTAIAAARYQTCADASGLPVAALTDELPAIAKRLILLAYADFLGCASGRDATVPADRTLSAYHQEHLLALCRQGSAAPLLSDQLPGGLRARVGGGRLTFETPTPPMDRPLPSPAPRQLTPGTILWDAGDDHAPAIWIRMESAPLSEPPVGYIWASARFPADRLPLPLWARCREPGDTIRSHGMTKSLKKLLCDKHIPANLRDRLPLICTDGGRTPLWFPGAAFRDGFPPPEETNALCITVYLTP